MIYKDWIRWMKSKPLYLRWFIIFMLLRPIAEQFYNLKEISPLLSPLYWIGLLTLVFSIIGIFKGRRTKTSIDWVFNIWGILIVLSALLLYLSSDNILSYFNFAIKLVLPLIVYAFLRVFIRSKEDLIGLITTFLISCIFPVLYLLIGLSGGDYFRQGRFSGSYADVFNNAFYLSIGLTSLLYLYINYRTYVNMLKISNYLLVLGLIVAFLGLWVIKHLATIVVLLSILSLFVFMVFRRYRSGAVFLLIITTVIVVSSGDKFYKEVLDPRLDKEVEVIEGTRGISQGLHGRMSRWTWLTSEFKTAPLHAKFGGYPLSLRYSNHMIGITPHNDFLRILFFTGYVGLFLYLLILFKVYFRIKRRDIPDRFFLYAVLIATVLYSITTVPTFYPGYVNILMIAIAYSSLPAFKKFRVVQG